MLYLKNLFIFKSGAPGHLVCFFYTGAENPKKTLLRQIAAVFEILTHYNHLHFLPAPIFAWII